LEAGPINGELFGIMPDLVKAGIPPYIDW